MRGNQEEKGKKLFIGGLHMKTSDETLHSFFSKWGELTDCVVMKDTATGRSRGFGFVTYKDIESVDAAQNNRPHEIDGIKVDTKRAMPKEDTSENHASVTRIFVGRLRKDMSNETLNDYFSNFGSLSECVVIKNPEGESRCFGFVTFDDSDSVDKVILCRPHSLDGHNIEVKKALPKDATGKSAGNAQPGRQGNEGRGGNRPNNYNISGYPNPNMAYNNNMYNSSYSQPPYQPAYNSDMTDRYSNAAPVAPMGYSDNYYNAGGYGAPPAPLDPSFNSMGNAYPPQFNGGAKRGGGAPHRGGMPPKMGEYNQRGGAGGGPIRGGPKRGGNNAGPRQHSYPY